MYPTFSLLSKKNKQLSHTQSKENKRLSQLNITYFSSFLHHVLYFVVHSLEFTGIPKLKKKAIDPFLQ